jgi:hypothetical protein
MAEVWGFRAKLGGCTDVGGGLGLYFFGGVSLIVEYAMLRDDDWYPDMSAHVAVPARDDEATEELTGPEERFANDDLDSVFGSAPTSPVLSAQRDGFDDTTGDSNDGSASREERICGERGTGEISDIPRLRERHHTEGYRDGVTQGKSQSIQEGFDEGYTLGAVFGLRIGKMLGLLEGIADALRAGGEGLQADSQKADEVLVGAKKELSIEVVFSTDYWGPEGIWLWDVPGEKDAEVLFDDVVGAHPLVIKWEGIVKEQLAKWDINVDIWEGEDADEEMVEIKAKERQDKSLKEVATEAAPVEAGQIMGIDKGKLSW